MCPAALIEKNGSGCMTHTYTFTPDQVGFGLCTTSPTVERSLLFSDSGDSRLQARRAKTFGFKGRQLSNERLRVNSRKACAGGRESIVEYREETKVVHGSPEGHRIAGFIKRTIGRKTFNGWLVELGSRVYFKAFALLAFTRTAAILASPLESLATILQGQKEATANGSH